MTMLPSRRALLYHANLFRYNYVSCLSSISHKNLAITPPEDLSQLYKTEKGPAQVDIKATGSRGDGLGVAQKDRRRRGTEQPRREDDTVADLAKAGMVGALDTGLTLGKIAKQTIDGVWDAVEKTAESVRDSVADDSRRRHPRTSGNHDDRSSDKFVEDLRRQDGGYDLNDRR